MDQLEVRILHQCTLKTKRGVDRASGPSDVDVAPDEYERGAERPQDTTSFDPVASQQAAAHQRNGAKHRTGTTNIRLRVRIEDGPRNHVANEPVVPVVA